MANTYIKPKQPPKPGLFGRMGLNKSQGSSASGGQSPLRHLPFLFFLTILGLIYIANNHYADDRLGQISKLEREVKRMQIEYSTLKYEYMTAKTKEDIAKQIEVLGLVPNDKPLIKIEDNGN
jgi:hypothetical protein